MLVTKDDACCRHSCKRLGNNCQLVINNENFYTWADYAEDYGVFSVSKITRGNKTYEVGCKTYEVGRKTYDGVSCRTYEVGHKTYEPGCRAEEIGCITEEVGIDYNETDGLRQKFYGVGSKQTGTVGHVALAPPFKWAYGWLAS